MHTTPMNSRHAKDTRSWYAYRWPWLLMLGPALVIVAGSYTCWLAFSRPDALVVDDYYVQGKAINQDLRRDRVAAGMGLHATLGYDPAAGILQGQLQASAGAPGNALRLHLVHATQPEKDIWLTLQPDRNGVFSVPLPMLEHSRWQVEIEDARRLWRLSGSWAWPKQASIALTADARTDEPADQ